MRPLRVPAPLFRLQCAYAGGDVQLNGETVRAAPIECMKLGLYVIIFFCFWQIKLFSYVWKIRITDWNRLMHALHGNGMGGRGKGNAYGKGKAKDHGKEQVEKTFAEQIRDAMPEAAKMRMQSDLMQDDWEDKVEMWQKLGSQGGVALVPKEALPEVLKNVGYTAKPTAAVITQDPEDLGLRAYPRTRVTCRLTVQTEGGESTEVTVQRWLVQLGFGAHVSMKKHGVQIEVKACMIDMVAKFSTYRGWQEGQVPAAFLIDFAKKHIDVEAIDSVQSRMDGSITFLCHEMLVSDMLRASGEDGVFIKQKGMEAELLWLDDGTPLKQARRMAEQEGVMGVVEKGKNGRLALRFASAEALEAFVTSNGMKSEANSGRWKVTGIPVATGVVGLYEILTALSWEVTEVVYMDENQAVFMAKKMGKDVPAHYVSQQQPRSVRFKALNSAAKKMTEAAAAEARGSGSGAAEGAQSAANTRAAKQMAFLEKAKQKQAPVRKATTQGRTGDTPDLKSQKTGQES